MKKLIAALAFTLSLPFAAPAIAQMGQLDKAAQDAKEAKKEGENAQAAGKETATQAKETAGAAKQGDVSNATAGAKKTGTKAKATKAAAHSTKSKGKEVIKDVKN
jgi:hypothetical protein